MKKALKCLIFMLLISNMRSCAIPENSEACVSQTDEYMILINSENPLDRSFVPCDLVPIKSTRRDGREMQKMRAEAAESLENMIYEMKKCNVYDENLTVTSGYRSFEYQKYLFDRYIRNRTDAGMSYEDAYNEVCKTTAKAGHSEHQSGLCVDFHNKKYANKSFADTPQYKWIEKNAHRFGFIVRYPQGKENITGISFEPWHLRYVGVESATAMYEKSLCLEEYVAALK